VTAPKEIALSDAQVARVLGLISQAREAHESEPDEFDVAPLVAEPAPAPEITAARIETVLAQPDDADVVLATEAAVRVEAAS
jgi:hypothetical protein